MPRAKLKKPEEPVLNLRPNPKQEQFFLAQARHVGYGGARGGGKSWAMRWKFVLLALNYPRLRLLLLRRTLPELRENHVIPLLQDITGFARYREEEKVFIFPNGSRLKLGYCDAENDVYQYQGQDYDVIGFEEATTFTEAQVQFLLTCNRTTRKDFKPRAYYTANPGGVGHNWFKRLFIDRVYKGKERPEDYVFIPARVYDNFALMESNPEYLEILDNLPEDLRRAHRDGDWDVFVGQYYKEWRREIHVIPAFEIPPWWKRFRCLDYGLNRTACYWIAVSPDNMYYAYRELYEPDLNLSQAAKKIVAMTPQDEEIAYTVASPDLWRRRQETGVSGIEVMFKAGLTGLVRAKHDRVMGWRVLREFLAPFEDEQGVKVARLRFFENCVNAIRTLPMLIHDEHNPEDVSDKCEDDAGEAIRYAVMSRAKPQDEPQAELAGVWHVGELRLKGYSEAKIRRLRKRLKVIGK